MPPDDLRHALRRLTTRPAAGLLSVALLAVGIGLSTAMFSVVDSLLLRRAPFPEAHRLVEMGLVDVSPDLFDAWTETGLFDVVEAFQDHVFRERADQSEVWSGARVTPGLFELLGVRAAQGRVFRSEDVNADGGDAVLLSDRIWRSAFGADPDVLGRRITLNGAPAVVVGIMPASFRFPQPTTEIWTPLDRRMTRSSEQQVVTWIVGRVKDGVPHDDASRRAGAIGRELSFLPPNYVGAPPLGAVGRPDSLDEFSRRALWLLLGGVILVFVVLCANVAGLNLASLSSRRREFGLCAALGAPRARLMRQALAEHGIVAIAGALAGVGVAHVALSFVPELFLGRTLNPVDLDPRALGTATMLGMASVVISGLLPAWLATRTNALNALRVSRFAGEDARSARMVTRSLLVGQVALACALLVGAGLLARSLANLTYADRGLNADGLFHLAVNGLAFRSPEATLLGLADIRAEAATWPEVEAAALSGQLPPLPGSRALFLGPPPVPPPTPGPLASQAEIEAWSREVRSLGVQANRYVVDSGFFEVFDITILRGRALQASDVAEAVVSDRLASLLWPGMDPIGRQFGDGRNSRYQVVGIAGELHLPTLDRELDRPEFYVPLHGEAGLLRLTLRCRSSCPDTDTIQARLRRIHAPLRVRTLGAVEDAYVRHLVLPRAIAQVGNVFAAVAVITVAGGLFSVMTLAVGRRRREFGIRIALGASPAQVRRLVLGDGVGLVAAGAMIGALAGWLVARSLAAFSYGVTVSDPIVWSGVLGVLLLSSLASSWRPAVQAMRVDPNSLLREE